jgi:hypothetical protein
MLPEVSEERLPFSKDQVSPYLPVRSAGQTLPNNCVNVVTQQGKRLYQRDRDILVQFYFHLAAGKLWIGRSSFAEVAAKATTARTCSSEEMDNPAIFPEKKSLRRGSPRRCVV